MKKFKKYLFVIFIIGFVTVNFAAETNATVSDFYKNTYVPRYATGLQPSLNFNMNMERLPKEDAVMLTASISNALSWEYTATYPNSANRTKILQSLLMIEADSLSYEIWFQYFNNQENYYAFVIQKTRGTFKILIRRNLSTLYTSQDYTIYSKYIMLDMITFITHFSNNLVEGWFYFKTYLDNGQSSQISYSYFQYQEASISLTNTRLLATYYSPNTNIVFCSRLIRYGSNAQAGNLYPQYFQELLFENSMDISYKSFIKSFENLPYLTYLSITLTSSQKLVPYVQNITYYNGTDEQDNPIFANYTIDFSYNFTEIAAEWEERRFYYDNSYINVNDWGNWGVMNWLRDGLAAILNTFITLLMMAFFLLIIALNYLLWIPFAYLIIILNNYVLFGIIWIIVGVVFVVGLILLMLWEYIILPAIEWLWYDLLVPAWGWIMQNIITPLVSTVVSIYNWLKEGGLQIIVKLFLTFVSYILAVIFLVLSGGLINYTETQQAIADFLIQLNSLFFQIGSIFISNFPIILGYSGVYILLVELVYLKYIYTKARGYIQRATKLQSMINVYKLPMVLLIRLSQYVIGFIQGGMPTDGADQ